MENFNLEKRINTIEIDALEAALRKSKGKLRDAGNMLGLSFRAMRYKVEKYQIKRSGTYRRKQFLGDNKEIIAEYLILNRKNYTKEDMRIYMKDCGFVVDLEGLPERREKKVILSEIKKLSNIDKIKDLVKLYPQYSLIIKKHMGDCDLDHSDECDFLFDLMEEKSLEFMERYYVGTYKIPFGPINIVYGLYHPVGHRKENDNHE